MLIELRIQDFAIIDDLHLNLDSGFTVFTGETGAGKSIIIDAVEMLLGGRADSTMVRSDAEVAIIEGAFRLEPSIQDEVNQILERENLLDDPEFLTLGREIRRQGRNICRVNGRTINLNLLRELGEWLVDVHGQSEHLSLLRVREHLQLLDRYAQVEDLRNAFADAYQVLGRVRREISELRQREQQAASRADLLAYQINEIETAALRMGEEAELIAERNRLANAEQLATLAEQAIAALDEEPSDREAITDLLGRATQALTGLAKIDGSMEETQAEAQALVEHTSDLARRLRVYREGIEYNPQRLDQVEERLGLLHSLQRKYGVGIDVVLGYAEAARAELEAITHSEERLQDLESEEARLLSHLGELGSELSQARRQAGERLKHAIEEELTDLRMEGANFEVDLSWEDDAQGAPAGDRRIAFSSMGFDQVEFLVAPNPGEGLKPLVKIASGGETSRLMLGLKSVLVRADQTPTLIFDEIDQGIGGRVGAIVGRKLWGVAHNHQVLCVTHLPQLGAFGEQHFKIEKEVQGGRTVTLARRLTDSERIPELASMLGGVSEPNLESAADLLRQAIEAKSVARVEQS
ncbi:MAG TPA: DNA repair protein RecN [Anaerolineae bacterium]|nr:DNA repair protein RecN [Anaerolineae bacterium]